MAGRKKRDSNGRFVASSAATQGRALNSGQTGVVVDAERQFGIRTMTALMQRFALAQRAGLQFEGARDLYSVFGYKTVLTPADVLAKYTRQDIASRIVDAPANSTWTNPPEITKNDAIKAAFEPIANKVKLWNAMLRADKMARMYPFSLLLFGFNDTGKLRIPVSPRATSLEYVRAFGSRQVEEITFNQDPRNPRFGMPEQYRIKFDDPTTKYASGSGVQASKQGDLVVHHSRVVHVVENPLEDLVFGTPIMEKVFNLLDDLLKVAGGTAEIFWLNGRGGMQANIDKEMELDPEDAADLTEEIEEFQHQLRRFIRTRGVDITQLDATVPDPSNNFDMIMSLISGTTGIPQRILLGAEAGQLASEQDRANWADRIEERRALFATPWVLTPTLQMLQAARLVPEGEVVWKWPSAFIQNPLEKGQTMAQTARAIGNISRQTGNQTPMPLVSLTEARAILGYEEDMSDEDMAQLKEFMIPVAPPAPAGGAAPTTPPNGDTPPTRKPPVAE